MTHPADGLSSRRAMQILCGGLEVYPSNAAPAGPVASPATNWGFGALAQLIPANQFNTPFYIAGITAYDNIAAQTGLHEVRLYYGATDILFSYWRFELDPANGILFDRAFWGMGQLTTDYAAPIPANARIRADLAYFNGGGAGASAVDFDLYVKRATG